MIAKKCFKKDWILGKKKELGKIDPVLMEKSIYALSLLCGLATSPIPFVFKGGTSMLLLLNELRRLSIDIDIVTDMPGKKYEPVLADIAGNAPFLGYEKDDRGKRGLPHRAHFKFFYDSAVSGRRDYVLLDILDEKNLYPKTEMYPVKTSLVELEKPVKVRMPLIDCLLGDKLTAFAPNTIGVRYSTKSGMQIVKQLFDIGELFNAAEDIDLILGSYMSLAKAEISYRDNKFTEEQSMDDTFDTAVIICKHGLKGVPENGHAKLLLDGIGKISSHLVSVRFRIEEAKIAASRALLLVALLKTRSGRHSLKEFRWRPELVSGLDKLILNAPFDKINRIKALVPEAFYNIYNAQELLKKNK